MAKSHQILELMHTNPERTWPAGVLAAQLDLDPPSCGNALRYLVGSRKVTRVNPGMYRLAPHAPQQADSAPAQADAALTPRSTLRPPRQAKPAPSDLAQRLLGIIREGGPCSATSLVTRLVGRNGVTYDLIKAALCELVERGELRQDSERRFEVVGL